LAAEAFFDIRIRQSAEKDVAKAGSRAVVLWQLKYSSTSEAVSKAGSHVVECMIIFCFLLFIYICTLKIAL
jgi:hypothetical protein